MSAPNRDQSFRSWIKERKERNRSTNFKKILIVVVVIVVIAIAFWIYYRYSSNQKSGNKSKPLEQLDDSELKQYLSNLDQEDWEELIEQYGKSNAQTD